MSSEKNNCHNKFIDPSVINLAEDALGDFTFPCCAISVKKNGNTQERCFLGFPDPEKKDPLERYALFDLASLTKPLATTLLALVALSRGIMRLDDEATYFLEDAKGLKNGCTIEDLLCHRSGLPAIPALEIFFPNSATIDRDEAIFHLKNILPACRPKEHVEYSCTGFLLLGLILERLGQSRLASLFRREIASPLGLDNSAPLAARALFSPEPEARNSCVPTEYCAWRARRIQGEVHDESSFCMGGDGGNAGLFANLEGVETLFSIYEHGAGIIPEKWVTEARACRTEGMEQRRGLGLLLSGANWSDETYGHTGFVGTSMWRDPRTSLSAILLTNRIYYGRDTTTLKIQQFREKFHARIALNGGIQDELQK